MSFKMDDYVDVAERIRQFYAKHPDGRLVCGSSPRVVKIGEREFIWYHAKAYRSPDDAYPADGWAAEPVPGPTQFTRDSELMNAETAAWGRAIVALGFSTKHIASKQDIENRSGAGKPSPKPAAPSNRKADEKTSSADGGVAEPTTGAAAELVALYGGWDKMDEGQRAAVVANQGKAEWLEAAMKRITDKQLEAQKSAFDYEPKPRAAA